jgi:hypothetical protein
MQSRIELSRHLISLMIFNLPGPFSSIKQLGLQYNSPNDGIIALADSYLFA